MANLFDPEFDDETERRGFACRRARLGRQAGAEALGASLYEVPPGQATFPYHWHSANEELLIVLRGRPSLRTSQGWRQLSEGEVVAFPTGERGAHQVLNRTEEVVRFLVVSEMKAPEMSLYPDTDKIGILGRPPGAPDDPDEIFGFFHRGDETDYWEGEQPPGKAPEG
jgi:uncharacterized cupin superfamily protein